MGVRIETETETETEAETKTKIETATQRQKLTHVTSNHRSATRKDRALTIYSCSMVLSMLRTR